MGKASVKLLVVNDNTCIAVLFSSLLTLFRIFPCLKVRYIP